MNEGDGYFWSKVDVLGPSDCWLWRAALAGSGYGIYASGRLGKRRVYAHRYAYELTHGAIPEGMFCLHKCDNPQCVNPAHLDIGTCADNLQDMVSKGRSSRGERRWCAKLTVESVREIRERYAKGSVSFVALANQYGVTSGAVQMAVKRVTWRHVE